MIATVTIADLPRLGAVRALWSRPKPGSVPGLRWANLPLMLPLASLRPPKLRRVGLLAFWDDETSAEEFHRTHPVAQRLAGGFHATLRPLRAFGTWPGLPTDIPSTRAVPHEGPVVVFTLGRLRPTQLVRFLRTSAPAEKAALAADGILWGMASARPPFVATVSMWEDSRSAAAYAYAQQRPQHSDAIVEQQRKDFHRESAFIRFAPISSAGSLDAPIPLPETTVTRLAQPSASA